jgi:flagellar basal-body rod modification protein FlgD
MEITATTTNPFAAPEAKTQGKKELGKDDFLRLLTTQLSNQDPLKPVDNGAFIAQLAQFASLEQMNKVGTGLESLLVAQRSSTGLQVASLVGKRVSFAANGVDLQAGTPATLSASLAQPANVTVSLQDANGRTVRTLPLGAREPGPIDITWDGRDDSGQALPSGRYRFVASGRGEGGAPVPVTLRTSGLVQGAALDGEEPVLLVGGARVKLSDVTEIHSGEMPVTKG